MTESDNLTSSSDESRHGQLKDVLPPYYGALRNLLVSLNQMILNASLQGGSFVVALISVAAILQNTENLIASMGSILILFGSLVLCSNLENQVAFFAGMLQTVVSVTDRVERLMLAVEETTGLVPSSDLQVTSVLRTEFPGGVFVKKREKFFPRLRILIIVMICIFLIRFVFLLISVASGEPEASAPVSGPLHW